MYNSITLTVHFHRPTCFEPLTWVHLQGHIIENGTLVNTNWHNYLHELFTIVHIHCLKQIKVQNCGRWMFQSYIG
jgi:hypothetical protein